jgi:hypothetical protein
VQFVPDVGYTVLTMKHQDSPNTSRSSGEHTYEVEIALVDSEGMTTNPAPMQVRAKSPVHARAKAVAAFSGSGLFPRVVDIAMVDDTDAEESISNWD